jgi:hypothetical protein
MRSKRCSCALVTGTTLLVMLGTAFTGSSTLEAETFSQEADRNLPAQVTPVREAMRIDFPGGTCGEYVDRLRKLFPDQSVVLAPGVSGFKMPPINVAINSILPGLKLACGIEGELIYQNQDDLTIQGTLDYERISEGLWRLIGNKALQQNASRGRGSRPDGQQSSGTYLKAYPAHDLIESGLTIEEVTNALDISFSMTNQAKPTIVVQDATMIIFLRGNMGQIESFEEIIFALEDTAQNRAFQNRRKKKDSNPVDEETRQKNRKQILEHIQKQLSE